ncbi:Choline-sulfatase [Limihaloglobus sulfuriphilus]|uniref:Choline-sulfatase n=1 Tax=Limihaloglobus sulfuriphilus TaxID=1851148 RepID=A0A1Q2MBK1_9BACT|nr:sulfatase [Limihaloglobus sulfuriphilus]AQQ70039.1 Choline-sulfatase [Limihaloglobus sulfuriphilus]
MRVLYLDLDTLRPDHLGCYGYHRNTSPNIDRIAAQGVRFENYYCSDAPCLPSRTAMMSGRFGIHTGVVGHGGSAADMRIDGEGRGFKSSLDSECLPAIFRRENMRTVLVSPFAERHSAFNFYAGFTEMYNTGKSGMESAEEVSPVALDWIKRNAKDDNWYLHINYWDPHTPYRAPEDFGDPFKDDPLPAWLTEDVLEQHKSHVGPHSVHEIMMFHGTPDPKYPRHPGTLYNMDALRKMIDGYDCGIRYMDEHIGRLFDELEKQGVLDDIMIIISADHGENLGELGIYGEHGTADRPTCRIPMIIRRPNGKPAVDTQLRYNLDLAPTLAEMFCQDKQPRWDGESFAGVLDGSQEPDARDYIVISQCAHVCQRSVVMGDWLYIRTYHDGYHLFPDEMLFNTKDDPYEQENLSEARPDVCGRAARYLEQWHEEMMSKMQCPVDPLNTVISEGGPFHAKGHLRDYVKRLEDTGRGWAVSELKNRYPGEFSCKSNISN